MRTKVSYITAILLIAIGAACAAFAADASSKKSVAENAISSAAKQGRYAFVTFYKKNNAASANMQAAIQSVKGKLANRADFVGVDIANPANKAIVSRYGADRSPIPLTVVVAPNGAVTAGFPRELRRTDFSDVFVSNGTAAVLKAMQTRKMAAICFQNAMTKHNQECLAIVSALQKDKRLGNALETVTVDPADRAESALLKRCEVNARSAEAQLAVMAPSGAVLGTFVAGNTTTNSVVSGLVDTMKGGGTCPPPAAGNATSAPPSRAATGRPTLVNLGTTTCAPCKLMADVVKQLSSEYAGKLEVVFINLSENQEATAQYGIKAMPTQIFYDQNGKEFFRHQGFFAKESIVARFKERGIELSDK